MERLEFYEWQLGRYMTAGNVASFCAILRFVARDACGTEIAGLARSAEYMVRDGSPLVDAFDMFADRHHIVSVA